MKLVLYVIGLLFAAAKTQEVLAQELPQGAYRGVNKEQRAVPRYYICGGAVRWKMEMIPQPNKCYTVCNRKKRWTGKKYCSWETKCDPVPPVLGWNRIDGMVFTYCHFQNWSNQLPMEEKGTFDWQALKMCPENMYVNGFKTKLTDRDGLAGLILQCRSMKNIKDTKEVLVFDGEGPWRDAVISGDFAVGFKAKYNGAFINGFALEMAPVPFIFAFNFQYKFPKDFKTSPEIIQNIIVNNFGTLPMRKEIEISREKQFQRTWQNEKSYLHGMAVSQLFSQTLSTKVKIGMPGLSSTTKNVQKQELTESRREEQVESFRFGSTEIFKVGQKQRDVVNIPPCTKYMIKQIVYSTDADVPYTLQIGYSNGLETEYEMINGWYRGVTAGEVQTTVNFQKLCDVPK